MGAAVYMQNPTSMTTGEDGAMMMADGDKMSGSESISSSFAELVRLGKSYHCTFDTTDDAGNATSGEVYVAQSGDKVNGDFELTQADGVTHQANVIRDGEYNYIWSTMFDQGFKSKIVSEDDSFFSSSEKSGDQVGFDEDADVDFDCSPWRVDNAMFVPPAEIKFADFSAQMEVHLDAAEEAQDKMKASCSVCDQAPAGASRDQCLQALGC